MFLLPVTENEVGKVVKDLKKKIISRNWWNTWLYCKIIYTIIKEAFD
jgi:hypothetical protein